MEVRLSKYLSIDLIKDNTDRFNYLKGRFLSVKKAINKIKNKWKIPTKNNVKDIHGRKNILFIQHSDINKRNKNKDLKMCSI